MLKYACVYIDDENKRPKKQKVQPKVHFRNIANKKKNLLVPLVSVFLVLSC